MEDKDIINLIQHRSEDGIRELSAKYGKLMHSLAINITGSPEDAEECVNDAYLAVWNAVASVKPDSLSAYCSRTVRNIAFNRVDYNMADKRTAGVTLSYEELEEIVSTEECLERHIEAQDLKNIIETFLKKQNDLMRQLFVLRYWYNYSFKELEEMSGIKSVTLRSKMARLKKTFKQFLRNQGYDIGRKTEN